jgi:hypothetical protein
LLRGGRVALVLVERVGGGWREKNVLLSLNYRKRAFAAGLGVGKCFGVYCGSSGAVSYKFFWLAEALPENEHSNRVVFKAKSADSNWDITSGADVLNVRWPGRVDADAYPRKFEPGTEQTIALASVLPKKVAGFENETANRRYLKRSDEEDYIEICQHIREQKPKWDMKDYATCLAAKTGGTRRGERKRKRACAGAAAGKQPTS